LLFAVLPPILDYIHGKSSGPNLGLVEEKHSKDPRL